MGLLAQHLSFPGVPTTSAGKPGPAGLSQRAGAAILAALMAILAALIMYGLGLTGKEAGGVKDAGSAVKPK
jgi:hypothetical protein